jgi:hypothetical protein
MPFSRSSSMVSINCFIERAKRSSFHTISVSPLRANSSASRRAGRMFTHHDFIFDRDRNLFVCPGGKELTFTCERGNDILMYRARRADCERCPLKSRCTSGAYRALSVNAHEEVRRHVARLSTTDAFQQSARLRRKVEMLFAHLKRNLNFRRLRLRGMTGARDECVLAATAQNLRKLVKLIGSSPPSLSRAGA